MTIEMQIQYQANFLKIFGWQEKKWVVELTFEIHLSYLSPMGYALDSCLFIIHSSSFWGVGGNL